MAIGNTNPQDIADPPAPGMLLAPAPVALARDFAPTLPFRGPSVSTPSAVLVAKAAPAWAWELLHNADEPAFDLLDVAAPASSHAAAKSPGNLDEQASLDLLSALASPLSRQPGTPRAAGQPNEASADEDRRSTEAADSLFALLADHSLVDGWQAAGR